MKSNAINRRKFLRMTAAAGAGATLFTERVNASVANMQVQSDDSQESSTIPVRTLGRTGLQIPILSMGVMRADNPSVLRAAYNSGIKHFDTAHGYQNGNNEEMIGNFFVDKPRASYLIATKVKFDYPLSDNFETEFMEMVDTSLKRLKMDYVDIFYIHAIKDV